MKRAAAGQQADKSGIVLLAAACVVFVLAYFAMLAGVADDTLNKQIFFGNDAPRVWLPFEWWLSDENSFWDARWSTANFLFSLIIIFPLFLLFGYVGGTLVYPFVVVPLAAAGWIVLCNAVFGKNHSRAAFIILGYALPLVYMAWFGDDVFLAMLITVSHFLSFAAIPWSLYLAVRFFQGGGRGFIVGFGVLSALSIFNNPVSMSWFFAPFAAALFLMFYIAKKRGGKKARQTISHYKTAFAAMTIGIVAGYLAAKAVPFAERFGAFTFQLPGFADVINTVINLTKVLFFFAKENPLAALVWLAFIVVATRKFIASSPFAPRVFDMPVERRLLFLFVPLSMAATVAAVVVLGLFYFTDVESFIRAGGFGGKRWVHTAPLEHSEPHLVRHIQPLLFLPLYAAWALYLPALRARIMGAALLMLAALALPRAAALDWQNLDPYNHPFYACIHEAAERLDAKGGVISSFFSIEIAAYPHWHGREYMRLAAARGDPAFLYVETAARARTKRASFDFVVTNAADGKVSYAIPGRQPLVCDYDKWHQCITRLHPVFVLDGQAVRGAFGEPQEVIQCPGNAAVYYYNPPIVVEDIHFQKIVGKPFNAQGWQMPTDE